jgi:A/G-specific adenine glycosylase
VTRFRRTARVLSIRTSNPAPIRRQLLRWYRLHAQPLPWRASRSAYRVWVSEVMLQQTQVRTVIPHYLRFIRTFPNLKALAAAPLERLLEAWSGLGYYRRARYLHQAARLLVRDFNGRLPREFGQLRALPGVGEYTARAILSIAFGQPYAIVDGNVARVVARLLALRGNLSQKRFRSSVDLALERMLSRRRPGEFNQALMEIGQTICLPRAPHCALCPLRHSCRARTLEDPERFPEPRWRRAAELHYLAAGVVLDRRRVLMVRGLDRGLLSDLWNFPAVFGASKQEARSRLQAKLFRILAHEPALETLEDFRHTITYRSIRGTIYAVKMRRGPKPKEGRWFDLNQLDKAAISQLARKVAGAILSPV